MRTQDMLKQMNSPEKDVETCLEVHKKSLKTNPVYAHFYHLSPPAKSIALQIQESIKILKENGFLSAETELTLAKLLNGLSDTTFDLTAIVRIIETTYINMVRECFPIIRELQQNSKCWRGPALGVLDRLNNADSQAKHAYQFMELSVATHCLRLSALKKIETEDLDSYHSP